jgi:hypothetical protein
MQRSKPSAYRAFREADLATLSLPDQLAEAGPTRVQGQPISHLGCGLARPAPYQRCTCGSCRECRDNAKWDRIFAKFEVKEPDERGLYRCALEGL